MSVPDPPILDAAAGWRRALNGLSLRVRAAFAREEFAPDPPPVFQYLLDQFSDQIPAQVWLSGLVENCLLRPGILDDCEATTVFRLALRHDETFDFRLVSQVLDRPGRRWPDEVSEFEMARLLDILAAAVKNWQRIRIPLLRFLRVPYPFIRSRIATLSHALKPNDRWFDALVLDPDPRVRANVLEGMALQDKLSPIRRDICQQAATDPHHRVQTTALFVLATFGFPDARPRLEALQSSGSAEFQRAATWALSKLGAPWSQPAVRTY